MIYPTPEVPTEYPVNVHGDRDPKTQAELDNLRARAFKDCQTESQLLGTLAGAASMCWTPAPAGVFDSELASFFTDLALARLKQLR